MLDLHWSVDDPTEHEDEVAADEAMEASYEHSEDLRLEAMEE